MPDPVHIPGYSDVFELGHKALAALFDGTVYVIASGDTTDAALTAAKAGAEKVKLLTR